MTRVSIKRGRTTEHTSESEHCMNQYEAHAFTWGFSQDAHLSTKIGHISLFQVFLGKNGQHLFVCTFEFANSNYKSM